MNFKRIVTSISNFFQIKSTTPDRYRKAKEYIELGELQKATSILEESDIAKEQKKLLKKKRRIDKSALKLNSDCYLTLAKLISRDYSIPNRHEKTISYYNKVTTNFEVTDTIPVFDITWEKNYAKKDRKRDVEKLNNWFRYKLQLDTLQIIE